MLFFVTLIYLLKVTEGIVNGPQTYQILHPYMVSIMFKKSPIRVCGGTLARVDYVISAAHCFDPRVTSDAAIGIRLGIDRLASKEGRIVSIDFVKTHPNYRVLKTTDGRVTLVYDIALVKMNIPISLNHFISLVKLTHKPLETGERCYTVGWGIFSMDYTAEGEQDPGKAFGQNQHTLRIANQTVIPLTRCQAAFGEKPTQRAIEDTALLIEAAHVCGIGETDVEHSLMGPSYGDAGGPLICNEEQTAVFSVDILNIDLDPHHYALYQRISAGVLDWLDTTMHFGRLVDAVDMQGQKSEDADPEARCMFGWIFGKKKKKKKKSKDGSVKNEMNLICFILLLSTLF